MSKSPLFACKKSTALLQVRMMRSELEMVSNSDLHTSTIYQKVEGLHVPLQSSLTDFGGSKIFVHAPSLSPNHEGELLVSDRNSILQGRASPPVREVQTQSKVIIGEIETAQIKVFTCPLDLRQLYFGSKIRQ